MNFNNPYQSYSNQSIWEGIKSSFKEGSSLIKLIYINIAVFLVVKILNLFTFFYQVSPNEASFLVKWLSIPAESGTLLSRPWSLFTHMFLHEGFLHILFNMLWLFWFGRIFLTFLDQKKLLSIYLLGGLTGAAFYMFAYNLFPVFQSIKWNSYALGASASVMAIVVATVAYAPNYKINLVFLGSIKIKHIAIFFIITDIIQIPEGNAGGHIAHLGGAFYGWLYISQLRKGKDIASFFNSLMASFFNLFKRKKNMKVSYKNASKMTDAEYNKNKKVNQDELNRILEKIAKSGYDSLTKQEKEILFKSSNQN